MLAGANCAAIAGAIELVANATGPREDINNHFGNAGMAVGGEAYAVNGLLVLLPWFLLIAALTGAAALFVRKRRA